MASFSTYSLSKLKGVNPLLVKVMQEAIKETPVDFRILEGLRTLERQKYLVAKGASKTLKSRHLSGKAVDVGAYVNKTVNWDVKYYKQIAAHVKKVANTLGVSITWGGDWASFPDYGHFELNKEVYGY